ncbi:hypothetical protein TNCV_1415811 [Trichonephila clavipes]|nr:hypothetical protein TNCV_1415811 [Trichonephila clavipes]
MAEWLEHRVSPPQVRGSNPGLDRTPVRKKVHGFLFTTPRPHIANIVKQFLSKKEVVKTEHPPFSPDLNLLELFLFPRLKLALKGKRFDDISDIQRSVTRLLNFTSKEDVLQSFQDMYSKCQRSIGMRVDYFEGH